VLKSQIRMPTGPLKTVGEHIVKVAPHTDVAVQVPRHSSHRGTHHLLGGCGCGGHARCA